MFGQREIDLKWIKETRLAKKLIPENKIVTRDGDMILVLQEEITDNYIVTAPKNLKKAYNLLKKEEYSGFDIHTNNICSTYYIFIKNGDGPFQAIPIEGLKDE